MDDWGNWRLNFLSREGREGGEVRRTGIFDFQLFMLSAGLSQVGDGLVCDLG
jgi:hypothetical protein